MLCQVLQGLLGRPCQGFLAQMDAWQNRVATDILLPVLRRDVFGKDVNATLRCGVGVRHQIAGYRSGRRYVDEDRTSVVSGKSVEIRVDQGGCRINKKN